MARVLARPDISDPVRYDKSDHIGDRKPLPPQQRDPSIATATLQIGIGQLHEGGDDIGGLGQPPCGTLFRTLCAGLNNACTGEQECIDRFQTSEGFVPGSIKFAYGGVDTCQRSSGKNQTVIQSFKYTFNCLDISIPFEGCIFIESARLGSVLQFIDTCLDIGNECFVGGNMVTNLPESKRDILGLDRNIIKQNSPCSCGKYGYKGLITPHR